eukprot:363925-Chlamydomonas_euryale.AAC.18
MLRAVRSVGMRLPARRVLYNISPCAAQPDSRMQQNVSCKSAMQCLCYAHARACLLRPRFLNPV